jgi:hypothetical protein
VVNYLKEKVYLKYYLEFDEKRDESELLYEKQLAYLETKLSRLYY